MRKLTIVSLVPEAVKDAFVRKVEGFTSAIYTGIPGIWALEQEINVVIEGRLHKASLIATSASDRFKGVPMVQVVGMGWVTQAACRFPHPQDYANADDIRPALLVRGLAPM